jgi:hypothetical protein
MPLALATLPWADRQTTFLDDALSVNETKQATQLTQDFKISLGSDEGRVHTAMPKTPAIAFD